MPPPSLPEPRIDATAVISPGAHVYGDVTIGRDSFVLFGAVIRAEWDRIDIGSETNIQDNAVLHCDEALPCEVGDRVTIGHSAVVHGAFVGDRSLIATGAKILNGSVVGEGAWVGAGSILPEGREIPPWTLAIGTPTRAIRRLTDDEIRRADRGVDRYLELADAYRDRFAL